MDNSINLLVNEEFSVYDKTSEIAIQRHGESKSKKAISKQDLSIKKFDKINEQGLRNILASSSSQREGLDTARKAKRLMNTITQREIMGNVWISDKTKEKRSVSKLTPDLNSGNIEENQSDKIDINDELLNSYNEIFAESKHTNSLENKITTLQNDNKDSSNSSYDRHKHNNEIISHHDSRNSFEIKHKTKSKITGLHLDISEDFSDLEMNTLEKCDK